MGRVPTVNIDYTSRDYESFRELLIQKLQEKMPEYTDTSETDAGIVILEALANGLDILSLYSDVIANDIILPTTQDRSLAVILSKCLGYTPYNQSASIYPQVFVLSKIRNEETIIPKGTVVCTEESTDLATLYFETMEELVIPSGKLGDEKDEEGNYLYTVDVQHGTTIEQDILGTSKETPLQTFNLTYTEVLTDSIELYVDEGEGQELWEQVENFIDCDNTSKVYMVSVDEFDVCTIQFGNGIKGKIPTAYPSGIIANYRTGGGEVSNVNANTITEMDSSVAYIEETFNLSAKVYGHDKESIDSIKENAPASFRTRDRLITLQDYSDLLRINFYDFLRLNTERDSEDKKLVHIYYMMREGHTMTESLMEDVVEYIAERSMIGTNFDISEYTKQPIDFSCVMYVDEDYDKDELVEDVKYYLTNVIFKYGELVFKDTIIKSDLENEIKNVYDGIMSLRINTPTEDIISPTSERNVLTLGNIDIEVKTL